MPLILDIQGFMAGKDKFIIKEFAAYNGNYVCHHVFKPPFLFACLAFEYQKQAKWLMAHHHAIDWEVGFTPHYLFPKIIKHITSDVTGVYVKGKEKADFIKKHITIPVFELPDTPAVVKRPGSCFYHMTDYCICALTNVYNLYEAYK